MKIFYVHHALRDTGNPPSQDDKLLPLGVKDAKVTANIFKKIAEKNNIKAIYTSPYYRCAKTAEIINKHINVPVYEDARLNEFKKVFQVLSGEKVENKTESWLECQNRIREAIKDIVFKYDEKDTVICVTSGVNITAFISLAYKIKPSEKLPFPWVPSCSPIAFEINKSSFDK